MKKLRIHWDKDYGIDNKTGWSICIDGSFVSELEDFLIIAVIKAIRNYMLWDKKYR